jgi:uncharacterized protein (TIGR00730 family)
MPELRRICVFCGSSPGTDPRYLAAARACGDGLVKQGLGLVYGGASVGLMGAVADAVLAGGGEVIGVIPRALSSKEITHGGLQELHVVGSMHDRKALMAQHADAFIALPGGFGTLEELFEVATWGQLGLHRKPFGLLNVDGYFDHLLAFLDHCVSQGFLRADHRALLLVDDNLDALLDRFRAYQPPPVEKWLVLGEE